ncbi:MAG: hypothetical protein FJY88_03490 [Candidatus Eisenbacteria bacterium]|nr:hypothetical protein [Candidatus Eisenbacteria bacterium]
MRVSRGILGFLVAAVCLLALSCSDDSDSLRPQPPGPLVYGSLLTPRVSMEADHLLADAYQHLGADRFSVAHLSLSWSGVASGPVLRRWGAFASHVRRALEEGTTLSVVLEIVHGGEADIPEWFRPEFPGWEDQDLKWELVRFLRELARRSQGTVGYLWLGEGADRYAASHEDEAEALRLFLAEIADSTRQIFPGAKVGTLITPSIVSENGQADFVRSLRGSLDLLGLSVFAADTVGGDADPGRSVAEVTAAIAPWSDRPFAILETGFPSTGLFGATEEQDQAAFASAIATWLRQRPGTLSLFCWAPLHDANSELSDSLARRRYPGDPAEQARFRALMGASGLRRNDGSMKPSRQIFYDERP